LVSKVSVNRSESSVNSVTLSLRYAISWAGSLKDWLVDVIVIIISPSDEESSVIMLFLQLFSSLARIFDHIARLALDYFGFDPFQ
jgi:hypothetical protein